MEKVERSMLWLCAQISATWTHMRAQEGQGALEYVAIVVGIIALVYGGFRLAGVDISKEASCFVDRATRGTGPASSGC